MTYAEYRIKHSNVKNFFFSENQKMSFQFIQAQPLSIVWLTLNGEMEVTKRESKIPFLSG